jgi:hypothetical protein
MGETQFSDEAPEDHTQMGVAMQTPRIEQMIK